MESFIGGAVTFINILTNLGLYTRDDVFGLISEFGLSNYVWKKWRKTLRSLGSEQDFTRTKNLFTESITIWDTYILRWMTNEYTTSRHGKVYLVEKFQLISMNFVRG